MLRMDVSHLMNLMVRKSSTPRRSRTSPSEIRNCKIEFLEMRTLLSESASAQLNLVSTTGTQGSPVYHYDITVTDTGTTNVGTFWFSWVPGEDFLPSLPSATSNPSGWSSSITGNNNSLDGSAIEWVATSQAITPGHMLSGYSFTSTDSPSVLAGNSPAHPGTPVLTASVYSGAPFSDGGFQFTVSPAVTTAASSTTVASSAPTSTAGTSVTITATVAPASGSGATPTGTVSFSQDGNALGTINVQPDGKAALVTSALPVGSDHITATYGGDSAYSGSASAPLLQTVVPPLNATTTTTSLGTSAPSVAAGTSVTLTATVTPATVGAVPTGTVDFTLNGNALASAAVQSDGTASLITSSLPIGADTIVATYNGDGNYAASASTPLVETITTPPTLVPSITKTTLPAQLVANTAAHGTVTLDITNETASLVKGKSTVAIYASTTGGIDGSAILVGQVVRQLNLKGTKSAVMAVPLKILPATLPAGSYTLFGRVTDPSANVNDSTAGPTVVVAAPFISLSEVVTRTTIPASALASAKAHAVVVLKITNNGNIITPGTTTAALFLTVSGVVDGSATLINSAIKPLHVRPGKSVNVNIPVKLIPAIAVGDYSVVAEVTDPNGQLSSVVVGNLTISV